MASTESHLNGALAEGARQPAPLPPPRPPLPAPGRLPDTYSVTVTDVPARDLLLALARDAALSMDIHPAVAGRITLHAAQQPVGALLARIARQADLRIEDDGHSLYIQPDTPFLRHYQVDYLNMSRQVAGAISSSTQITGGSASPTPAPAGTPGGNLSSTRIENVTKHQFWESLEKNLRDLLRETDKPLPEGSSDTEVEQSTHTVATGPLAQATAPHGRRSGRAGAPPATPQPVASESHGTTTVRRSTVREAAAVILNPESGLISVRATGRQHEVITEFIRRVSEAARRQVMIEATLVEVELTDTYRQGIDWSRLRADQSGFSVTRPGGDSTQGGDTGVFSLVIRKANAPLNLTATLDLLRGFGATRVLSSPRLSVLNNQTALLKVVDNVVYFNVRADTTSSATAGTTTAVTTIPQSVSVGLVLAVTPQVGAGREVVLNIRPSISSVSDWRQDPNPNNKVPNLVPQIRTREIESVMRVASGDIAVLGGLMEDSSDGQSSRLPGPGDLPVVGEAFTQRANRSRKSELLVFLRPRVIEEASLAGDFAGYADRLPGARFFERAPEHRPFALPK